jgi:sec-independent protein translocase protein TatC
MSDKEKTGLSYHLEELRRRLIVCLIALAAGTIVALIFAEQIFSILIRPAGDISLVFIEVTEMLGAYMQVSLTGGIALAMPVLVYELMSFTLPALKPGEKKVVWLAVPFIFIMFTGGVLFAYYVLVPPAMQFLLGLGQGIAAPQIRISNYITLVSRLLLAVGLVFELPVLITFLARLGIISWRWLLRQWKWAVILAFLLGAVITPTIDPVNQTLVALPLIVLYLLSILLARIFERRSPNTSGRV